MMIHQVSPDIYHIYSKIEQIANEWSVFGLFLVISGVGSDFQNFSVLGDFDAFNHFVSHRYP